MPAAVEVPRVLQLPQGVGNPGLALGEVAGQFLDADPGTLGQRLDVDGEADRGGRQPGVLGEVVADHGELGLVVVPDVDHSGRRRPGARGGPRAKLR
ncbi:hypothetical protein ABZW18_09475 [Streptomyces sp. NPDC004647]|uniref:hypothetical protein n=1 Tax=Streptomyces sp. NPDC004647 TaxID=3154671 RepID=UPI0033B96B90